MLFYKPYVLSLRKMNPRKRSKLQEKWERTQNASSLRYTAMNVRRKDGAEVETQLTILTRFV